MSKLFQTGVLAAAALAGTEGLSAQIPSPLRANIRMSCTETYGPRSDADHGKTDKEISRLADERHIFGNKQTMRAKVIAACEEFEAENAKQKKKYAPAAALMQQIVHTIGESEMSPNVDESQFKRPFDKVAFEKAVNDFVGSGAHLMVYNQSREKLEEQGLERRPAADLSAAYGNATSPYENPTRKPRKELSGSDAVLYLLRTLNRLGIDIADERYPAIEAMKEKLEAIKTILRAGILKMRCGKTEEAQTPRQRREAARVSQDWLKDNCPAEGAVR